jgi:predicted peroxiredoxin
MKRNALFILSCLTLTAAIFLACTAGPQPEAESTAEAVPATDGVFLHVSSGPENPHRVLMAMKMAELMKADRDVLMYFDIEGVHVLLADSATIEHEGFTASDEQIATLLELGVPIFACPACLAAAGKTPEDLREGIQVANKDAFFSFTDGRILTLDY